MAGTWPALTGAMRVGGTDQAPGTDFGSPEGGCGAEREIRAFGSSCLPLLFLLPPFRSPCSRLENEFEVSFEKASPVLGHVSYVVT